MALGRLELYKVLCLWSPARNSSAMDRPADLGMAGGKDRSLKQLRLQRGRVEGNAAGSQQARDPHSRFANQRLVGHVNERRRQQCSPVCYQAVVALEYTQHVVEVVVPGLVRCEVGRVQRPGQCPGVAPAMNNWRVGEEQPQKAGYSGVGRQLVNHPGSVQPALEQSIQILLAGALQRLALSRICGRGQWVCRTDTEPLTTGALYLGPQRQFTARADLWMAGENLLDQRGPRARQTGHEHRRQVDAGRGQWVLEQSGVPVLQVRLQLSFGTLGVVANTALVQRCPRQVIREPIMVKGGLRVARLLEQTGVSKVNVDTVCGWQRLSSVCVSQFSNAPALGVLEVGFQVNQVVLGLAGGGSQCQRPTIALRGSVCVTACLGRMSGNQVREGMIVKAVIEHGLQLSQGGQILLREQNTGQLLVDNRVCRLLHGFLLQRPTV